MTMNLIMFYLFSTIIVIFSIMTVTSRRILRAATYLLFVLISTAGVYFMLNYFFLAAVQLTLYAGGVVVLIVFSILLTSHIDQKLSMPSIFKALPTAIVILLGIVMSAIAILSYEFKATSLAAIPTNMRDIGLSLMSMNKYGYVLPFEVVSILLLAAMIGAIVIAKKAKNQ